MTPLAGVLTAIPLAIAGGCESLAGIPITYAIDYVSDVQSVWETYCANCHVNHAGAPSAGLDLEAPYSFEVLTQNVSAQDFKSRLVIPGQPLQSLLFRKLSCDQPGPLLTSRRMPLDRVATPLEVQALVFDWIASGAPYSLPRIYADGLEEPKR